MQRQRNQHEKLKNEGKYDDYKTKEALYTKINDLQKEEKLKKTEENRLKEKLQKRIYQEKKETVYHRLREDQDFHLFKV